MDDDGLDQFLDEHASLGVVGVLPHLVEIERRIAKEGGGLLEGFGECVGAPLGLDGFALVGVEGVDLRRDGAFLLGEVLAGDVIIQEQLQEPFALSSQVAQCAGVGRLRRPTAGRSGLGGEVAADGLEQLVVGAQQVDAESCGAVESAG